MDLKTLLYQKKSAIIEKWIGLTLETYPADSREFLSEQGNSFANPVGSIIRDGFEQIYAGLLGNGNGSPGNNLEEIIKVRAVQDFSPSQAVSFLSHLKQAVREEAGKEIGKGGLWRELLEFEAEVDRLTFQAFDLYMYCREKIFRIRIKEISHAKAERAES